jgi:hypothetical protein
MAHFLSPLEAENAAHRLGYHAYFVRANNADCNPAGRRGNHALIETEESAKASPIVWGFA